MNLPVPRRRHEPAGRDRTHDGRGRSGGDDHRAVDGFSELVAEVEDVLTDALAEMEQAVRDVVPAHRRGGARRQLRARRRAAGRATR